MLGAAVAACGSEDDTGDGSVTGGTDGGGTGGTGGTGGGGGDAAGGSGAGAYKWLAIVDDVSQPACTGTGPGADIDSIEVKRAGTSLGVGLMDSASWVDAFPGGPTVVNCSTCGSAMAACPHSGNAVASRIEGVKDARSYANMPDMGYISLNGGFVWVQLGDSTGGGAAQDIRSGDVVTVNEVDRLYVAAMSANEACACPPEKYSVYAYVEKGQVATRVKLTAMPYKADNAAMCGTFDSEKGCGTTDFTVP